jgi:hypothetical protein
MDSACLIRSGCSISIRSAHFPTMTSSSSVASCLIRFALFDMTRELPGTYPSAGRILSRLGLFGVGPLLPVFVASGMPKTGQVSGQARLYRRKQYGCRRR